MEVKGFSVSPEDCGRMIFLAPSPRKKLAGTKALDYIDWGKSQGYQSGATCAQRVTDTREWYDLTAHRRGVAFWPKSQRSRHVVPRNERDLQANCNLYKISFLRRALIPSR